jgi:elongation factor P
MQPATPFGMAFAPPEWRRGRAHGALRTQEADDGRSRLAFAAESGIKHASIDKCMDESAPQSRKSGARPIPRKKDVRVIASSIRKGNIIERDDGQLCVVLSAESFHPGKGTPTTQIDMRRLSDGVKLTDRFKTTEQVERAFVEDKNFDFLYGDADGYHFMNADTYDQIQVPSEVIGDQAQWLQEGMKVILSIFNETPVGIQLPPRVTLEVTETEPAMKGQTASSSYKPARLANGARVMVPPHITVGTRIVIQTEDGGYVERAKD